MKYDIQYINAMTSKTTKGDDLSLNYFIDVLAPKLHIIGCKNNNLTDPYSVCDMSGTIHNNPIFIESKSRKGISSTDYPDAMLSVAKFNNLRKLSQVHNGYSCYVCFYLDCWCIWNVNDDSQINRWGSVTHSKTTEFSNHKKVTEYCPFFKIVKKYPYIYE